MLDKPVDTREEFEYDPKALNQFIVKFPGDYLPSWTVDRVTLPTYLRGYDYKTGDDKPEWGCCVITFLDPVEPRITQKLYDLTVSGSTGSTLFTSFEIYIIDNKGNELEKWVIGVDVIDKVYFGQLNYSEKIGDTMNKLELHITPTSVTLIQIPKTL